MNQSYLISNNAKIPNTHFFTYRSNKYPFNFDIFKYSTKYLFQNQIEFQKSTTIRLIENDYEEEINLSDSSIHDFINFCHNQSIKIHNQNAIELNFLAKKFIVSSLIENTEYYISSHINDLILQKLSIFKNKNNLETEKYEDIIAEKLPDYINDDLMLSLSLPVIHRILTKYLIKSNKSDIFPFLLKCLDKFGREASILFSNIDFGNEKAEYLNILLTKYSKIFDFHFINDTLTKTLYESQNDIFKKEEMLGKQQNELMNSFNSQLSQIMQDMNKMFQNHKEELQTQKKIEEEKNNKLFNQINEMKKEHLKEIQLLKKANEQKTNELTDQIINMKKANEQKTNELTDQIIDMKKEISKMKSDYLNEIQFLKNQNAEKTNELNVIIDEMKIEIKDLKLENKNTEEKVEQLNKIIGQTNQLKKVVFTNITIEAFNQLNGDDQEMVINEMVSYNKSPMLSKIQNFLSYLSDEYQKLHLKFIGSNRIFIPTYKLINKAMNLNELNDQINIIGLSKDIIEVFYKNKINVEEFKLKISQFDQIYLEIQYPSLYFKDVYDSINNTNVQIALIISEFQQNDAICFKNNSNISSVLINAPINSISNEFKECSSIVQISLPPSIKTIGNNAFSMCTSLTQIQLPSSVNTIGDYSFYGCSSLKHISIPNSVTSIGFSAFKRCISLVIIEMPSSVESIGSSAFRECSSLMKINIPSSVKSIGKAAFFYCTSLVEINLPSSLSLIEKNLFKGCTMLKSISIPSSVTSIGVGAFSRCFLLRQIHLPSTLTTIEDWAFSECYSLSKIDIPPLIISIKSYSFEKCISLSEINIPSSVTSIKNWAFSGCSSLNQLNMSSSITSIGDSAFKGCTSLTKIELPSSLTTIGINVFKGCFSLENISIPSSLSYNKNCFPQNVNITIA